MMSQPYQRTDVIDSVVARAHHRVEPESESLATAIRRARKALMAERNEAGYWCYEFEADCTIPAEYILMMHFMNEVDEGLEAKIAVHLRAHQAAHGGWSLYYGGDFNLSCSVKVYYALKIAGDDPRAPHMVSAREAILAHGGAARSNVFTRITLALFAQVPWRACPSSPSKSCCCPSGFRFTSRRFPTGLARSWCRCLSCAV